MKVIPWEDNLSSEQQSLIVGSMLGDARLECRSKSGSARLRIHHADRQRDYVFWKYHLLKPLVVRAPWKTNWIDTRNGFTYVSWFFHTRTMALFEPWWRRFYLDGKKILPKNIEMFLDPMALAVWLMDDGCFQKNSIILNTQSFTMNEYASLQDVFRRHFGIHASIQKDRQNVRLYFGKREVAHIMEVIHPFLLPTFYKIVPVTTDPVRVR